MALDEQLNGFIANHQISLENKGFQGKPLKYFIIEDAENGLWFLYDKESHERFTYYFGEIVIGILNNITDSFSDSPHHEKYKKGLIAQGVNMKNLQKLVKTLSPYKNNLSKLKEALVSYSDYAANHTKSQLKAFGYQKWLKYRHLIKGELWSEEMELNNISKDDILRNHSDYTDEELKRELKIERDEAFNYNVLVEKMIREYFFIYHDVVAVPLDNGDIAVGRSYVTSDISYLFINDLFYVLQGRTTMPHLCPRCKRLFLSNNYKAKYCASCKEDSNIIREENRKKNPARLKHKNISDSLRNTYGGGTTLDEFITESNYYWERVQGKKVSPNPGYDENIQTKEDYLKWLEDYQAKIRKRKKLDKG